MRARIHPLLAPLVLVFVGLIPSATRVAAATPPQRCNILYILADDMGVGDVSCLNSNSAWKTPNLDRLARGGRVFTDAHSASAVCTPSRYALLTGRYAWRGRLKANVLYGYDPSLIEKDRLTVPMLLKSNGYVTAMIGKWHLGIDWQRHGPKPEDIDYTKSFGGGPLAHGFDHFLGISASLDMPPYVYLRNDHVANAPTGSIAASSLPKMWRAGPISPDFVHEEVQSRFVGEALEFIADRARSGDSQPFFLYLALASPHTPIVPTKPFAGKTHTNPYGDFVTQVDADVGALLDTLEHYGLATNTLVIFTADNGCSPSANFAQLRKFHHDPSAGFRGHKADLFEGGHRIPFIARWAGQIPAGTRCEQAIEQADLLATVAEILGVKLPETAGEDSVSILPLLRGDPPINRGRAPLVHHSINGSFAIREGRWKLLLAPDSGGWSYPRPINGEANGLPRFQLYDVEADPAEKVNLQAEHPEIVRRLGRLMRGLLERGRSTPGASQPYHAETPWPQKAWTAEFGR